MSVSFKNSRTISPSSFSTINTCRRSGRQLKGEEESAEQSCAHLFRLGHPLDHDETKVREHLGVDPSPARLRTARTRPAKATEVQKRVRREFAAGELLHLVVQVGDEFGPVLEADLEDLALLDLRDLDQVQMRVQEYVAMARRLEDGDVGGEEVGEEEGEVQDELLIRVGRVLVGAGDVCEGVHS